MAKTRSKAAAMARLAALNPQSVQAFKEGLGSVLRQWTALELAVFHQWGGPSSKERAETLNEEIFEMFLGPDKVYRDDISLVLEDYLETEFNTICEDGSPDELGELFVTMWRQCMEGNYTLVTDILAKEYVRHEMVSRSQGLVSGDIDDHSDDGMDDTAVKEAVEEAVTEQIQQTEDNNNAGAAGMEDEDDAPPLVDPDGWETVDRSRKGKNKKRQYKI
jgi:pre-rRNA-processing protein TSR2